MAPIRMVNLGMFYGIVLPLHYYMKYHKVLYVHMC